jgi:hypothetical protein
MGGTGFIDNIPTLDDDEDNGPPPVKKKKDPEPDYTNMPIEEILDKEAENDSLNQLLKKAKPPAENEIPKGYSGEGSSPAKFPVMPQVKGTQYTPLKEKVVEKLEVVEDGMEDLPSGFDSGMTTLEKARAEQKRHHAVNHQEGFLLGICALPKSGKSSLFYDSISEEDVKNGATAVHIDFDGFGRQSVLTNYPHLADSIIHVDPLVLHKESKRALLNYPDTQLRVITILRDTIEEVKAQRAYFQEHGKMPEQWIKSVCLDGVGKYLKICEICMKIVDLDLGDDAIAVSGQKTNQDVGWGNWYIRTNYYDAMLELVKQLCRLGVHTWLIGHLKEKVVNKNPTGEWEPDWLKVHTEKACTHVVHLHLEKEEDEETGALTGVTESWATIEHNALSLKTPGRVLVYRQDQKGGEWFGWPELRTGDFSGDSDGDNGTE